MAERMRARRARPVAERIIATFRDDFGTIKTAEAIAEEKTQ
jgi:hypothetical protein